MAEARVIPLDPAARGRSRAADAVSAGADRAGGERARRRARTSPLLGPVEDASGAAPGHGPSGQAGTGAPPDGAPAGFGESLLGLLGLPELDLPSVEAALRLLRSGAGPILDALAGVHRSLTPDLPARLAALSPEDLDERLATATAFLSRRFSGDLQIDDFGLDRELAEQVVFPLLRPLYREWFRVDVRGIQNLPAEGGALLVANHSGVVAIDGLMTQLAVHDEHPAHRILRMLAADMVFDIPVIGELARKTGATLASTADAERLLRAGELVGVWPEGFKGIGKPFGERYKLQRFGRGGFVSAALRTGAPIVPCSIVGAEEIYPMIGNLPTLARLLGTPYFPVTPTFPWLGPLGLVPLPSKWLIEFGEPIDTSEYSEVAAEDPMLVFDLTDRVRQTIQQTLYALLLERRSVFF